MRDRLNRMSTKTGSPLNKFSTDGGWLVAFYACHQKDLNAAIERSHRYKIEKSLCDLTPAETVIKHF